MKKASWKSRTVDAVTTMDVIDSEDQLLQFRVGQVFFKKGQAGVGLWIWYQEKNHDSKQEGPVLIDKDSWSEIKRYIDKKFRSYEKR